MNKSLFNSSYSAPSVSGISYWINNNYINGLEDTKGKVVLLNFWTYSCINCIRLIPILNYIYHKYQKYGLEIIGIHSPEFIFEHDLRNVRNVVRKYNIQYPIGLDNRFETWNNYKNIYWPTVYVVDKNGTICYSTYGEWYYEDIEKVIVNLLGVEGVELGNYPRMTECVDYDKIGTAQTYLGLKKMRVSRLFNFYETIFINNESTHTKFFSRPEPYTGFNSWRLEGNWKFKDEYVQHMGKKGRIGLNFDSKRVNLVVGLKKGKEIRAKIYLNNKLIDNDQSGRDVFNSEICFSEERMYNIVDQISYSQGHLEIEFDNSGIELYSFTFG